MVAATTKVQGDISNLISRAATRRVGGCQAGQFGGVLTRISKKLGVMRALGLLTATSTKDAAQKRAEWRRKVVVTALQRLNGYIKRGGVDLSGLFKQIDEDNSGAVDHQEFRSGLAKIGLKFDDEVIEQLVLHMDEDNSGSIQYEEFGQKMQEFMEKEASKGSAVLASLCRQLNRTEQSPEELFGQLDVDGDGSLAVDEFHSALTMVGVVVTKEAAARAMKELDLDGDGSLTSQELVKNVHEFRRKRRVFAYSVLGRVMEFVERTNTSVARLFSKLDTDGSGDLDVLELQEVLRKMRVDLNEVEVEEIMDELDLHGDEHADELDMHNALKSNNHSEHDKAAGADGEDGGGNNKEASVSLTKFLDKLELFQKEQTSDTEKCAALFKEFDSDGSGFLEPDEVKQLAEHLGLAEKIAEDKSFVERMVREIETTRAGYSEDQAGKDSGSSSRDGNSGPEEESDGQVNYEEFLRWFLKIGRSYLPRREYIVEEEMEDLSREQLRELFDKLDADGSG